MRCRARHSGREVIGRSREGGRCRRAGVLCSDCRVLFLVYDISPGPPQPSVGWVLKKMLPAPALPLSCPMASAWGQTDMAKRARKRTGRKPTSHPTTRSSFPSPNILKVKKEMDCVTEVNV